MKKKRFLSEQQNNDKLGALLALIIWLLVWQIVSVMTGLDLILSSPFSVLKSICLLMVDFHTYKVLFYTIYNVVGGFLAALIIGTIMSFLASEFAFVKNMLKPPVLLMKSLPMASFIILLLIWFGSGRVSMLTACIVAFPLVYNGVAVGLSNVNKDLLELACVYNVSKFKKFAWIYAKQILPIAMADIKMAVSMSFKAGVSAEVIGLAKLSVGEQLYYSKLYIETSELFAWSLLVVLLSLIVEKIIGYVLNILVKAIKKI